MAAPPRPLLAGPVAAGKHRHLVRAFACRIRAAAGHRRADGSGRSREVPADAVGSRAERRPAGHASGNRSAVRSRRGEIRALSPGRGRPLGRGHQRRSAHAALRTGRLRASVPIWRRPQRPKRTVQPPRIWPTRSCSTARSSMPTPTRISTNCRCTTRWTTTRSSLPPTLAVQHVRPDRRHQRAAAVRRAVLRVAHRLAEFGDVAQHRNRRRPDDGEAGPAATLADQTRPARTTADHRLDRLRHCRPPCSRTRIATTSARPSD